MAIPDYQSIMLPLLELAGDDQIHRVRDAVDLLAQQFKLTAEERRAVIPSGRVSRFHNNVTWARTYLKKAGLLEDPKRGEFRITERGRQVLAGGHGSIGVRFLEQFEEFKKFKTARRIPRPDAAAKLDLPEETPEEALQAAYQTLRNSVASDLLDQVRRSSPAFFERLVVDVLVAMGYGGSRTRTIPRPNSGAPWARRVRGPRASGRRRLALLVHQAGHEAAERCLLAMALRVVPRTSRRSINPGRVVRDHPARLPVPGEHHVVVDAPRLVSSDASPTRPEWAVTCSTPAARAVAGQRAAIAPRTHPRRTA